MPAGLNLKDPHALLAPETRSLIPPEVLHRISEILASSIVQTFAWACAPAVLALLAALFMGSKKLDHTAEVAPASSEGKEYSPVH